MTTTTKRCMLPNSLPGRPHPQVAIFHSAPAFAACCAIRMSLWCNPPAIARPLNQLLLHLGFSPSIAALTVAIVTKFKAAVVVIVPLLIPPPSWLQADDNRTSLPPALSNLQQKLMDLIVLLAPPIKGKAAKVLSNIVRPVTHGCNRHQVGCHVIRLA
jgi:hypothetical protein